MTTERVFPEWRQKSLDDALYECREMVESPDFVTVSRWRANGGRSGAFPGVLPRGDHPRRRNAAV